MIRIAGLIALAGIALASSNNASASTRRYDFSAIEAELARQCRSGDFSGVVLVRAQGRTVFEKECGEADIINHVPITRATRFRIHSTSKLMTALAVMRLVELHRIDLDGSIADYVPDVPVEWNPVTVRELLNHTSGIGDFTEQLLYHFRADHPSAMRLTLGALSRSERSLKSKPGQRFSYNNFGFELLADAGARVTGKPFATVVQELVFGPAGMATSSLQQPTIVDGHPVGMREKGLALGYNGSPSDLEQTIPFSFVQLGAGAVRAGAEDFVALDDAITSGKIVTPETWRLMTADPVHPQAGDNAPQDHGFGLGVILENVDGVPLEGHTGGVNGFISDFERYSDDGAMLIALSNRGFTKTTWLRHGVAEVLKRAR